RAGLNPFSQLNRLVQRQLLAQALRARLDPQAAAERRALLTLLPPRRSTKGSLPPSSLPPSSSSPSSPLPSSQAPSSPAPSRRPAGGQPDPSR
ncbi:MAG: hypothetical protein VKK62_11275, partial [Synechococcaceae cyanobacterium]|nr:hypothetical protein [Synechococcaceae cyanobacterium]